MNINDKRGAIDDIRVGDLVQSEIYGDIYMVVEQGAYDDKRKYALMNVSDCTIVSGDDYKDWFSSIEELITKNELVLFARNELLELCITNE